MFGKLEKIDKIYSGIKKNIPTVIDDYSDYLSDIPKDSFKRKLFDW